MKSIRGLVVWGFVGIGALVGVSACSSSDGAPVAANDFAERLAQTLCNGVAPCCRDASIAYDSETCLLNARAGFGAFVAAHSSSAYRYDAAQAAVCVSAVERVLAACEDFDDDTTGVACEHSVFRGTLPVGSPCEDSDECADYGVCKSGNCAKSPEFTLLHGKAGDDCTGACWTGGCQLFSVEQNPATVCYEADGLYCPAGKCVALGALGTACTDNAACGHANYCDVETSVCTARKNDGEACTEYYECKIDDCTSNVCRRTSAAESELCSGEI
jgi:hypothetical protein